MSPALERACADHDFLMVYARVAPNLRPLHAEPRYRSIAQRGYPWLWDPIATYVLQLPASVTGFIIGAFLLWLGKKPLEPIGYLAGR